MQDNGDRQILCKDLFTLRIVLPLFSLICCAGSCIVCCLIIIAVPEAVCIAHAVHGTEHIGKIGVIHKPSIVSKVKVAGGSGGKEVFYLLAPTGLTINIELKTGIIFYENIEEKILDLTKKMGWEDRVIYSSFNHYSVRKIKELDPGAKVGLLYGDGPIDMPGYGRRLGADALHPAFYNLQYPDYMEDCRRYGLDVNVWTVNSTADLMQCREYGVNAVITNYPDKALKLYGG